MTLKSPGVWKNKLELWKYDKCVLSSKLGWSLSVALLFQNAELQLKVKSIPKGIFFIQDENENILVQINANVDRTYAKANFEIEILDEVYLFTPEVLLFLIHNCNYFMVLSSNGNYTTSLLAGVVI